MEHWAKRLFVGFLKDSLLVELQARMSSGCRFLHHNYQVSLRALSVCLVSELRQGCLASSGKKITFWLGLEEKGKKVGRWLFIVKINKLQARMSSGSRFFHHNYQVFLRALSVCLVSELRQGCFQCASSEEKKFTFWLWLEEKVKKS